MNNGILILEELEMSRKYVTNLEKCKLVMKSIHLNVMRQLLI